MKNIAYQFVATVFAMCIVCIVNIPFSIKRTEKMVRVEPTAQLKSTTTEISTGPEEIELYFVADDGSNNAEETEPQMPTQPVQTIKAAHSWTSEMPLPSTDRSRVPGRRLPLLPALPSKDWRAPPVELRGQVTMQTMFGQELYRLVQLPDVHLALEIGTWYGGGSSWCIAQGLRSSISDSVAPDKWLITLELFEPAWEYAAKTLERLPVTCMRGGTVGIEGYVKPEEMTPEDLSSEHYRLYYERDVKLAIQVTPLLERLCLTYDFDFVLIDGNEYTGLAEFEIVDQVCRPTYLALHDTGTLKTRRVEELLSDNADRWTKVSSGMDAAGWAVYRSADR